MPSEVISDLLKIPDVKERAGILSANPQIRGLVEGALDNDVDYQAADEAGKIEIRSQLGFPTPTPGATQLGWSPNFPLSGPPKMAFDKEKHTVPTQQEYFRVEADAVRKEGQSKKTLPLTITNVPQIVEGYFQENFKAPMIEELYSRNPDALSSKIGRGVISAVPIASAALPKNAPPPEFFSIENSARIATDFLVTLPIFAAAPVAALTTTAAQTFTFFLRHPGLARTVAEAAVVGGLGAGYQSFVRGTNQLIQNRQLNIPQLRQEFGTDFTNMALFAMGFAGVGRIGAAMLPPNIGRTATEGLREFSRELAGPGMPGQAPAVTGLIPPYMQGMPPALSKTGVQGPPSTPQWRSSVKPFTTNEVHARTWDEIAALTKIDVRPNGEMDFTIAEPVLRHMFAAPKTAVAGDVAYWRTEGGQPRVGRVISALEDSLLVHDGRRLQTVKFSEIETAKRPFEVGSEVYSPMGEPLTVKGYTPDGKVWVQGFDGKLRIETSPTLRSYNLHMTTKATAERVASGIDSPEPHGTSVFDIFTDEGGVFVPGKFNPLWRRRRAQDMDDIAKGKKFPLAVATQPGGHDLGTMRYFLDPMWTLSPLQRPEYDLGIQMLMRGKEINTMLEAESTKMLQGFRRLLGDDARFFKDFKGGNVDVSEKLARFALGLPKPGETLSVTERTVLDTWNQWVQRELIPSINAKRAIYGQSPVPPDYNWGLQLFPELVLNRGYAGGGLSSTAIGRLIKVKGIDNEIEIGGVGARLTTNANFWELAQQAMRWAAHEKAWRDPVLYFDNLARAESSTVNQKYLRWLSRHLDGQDASPAIADITEFSRVLDQRIMEKGGKYANALLELDAPVALTYKGKSLGTLPKQNWQFESPMFSIAETKLGDAAMQAKQLSYANTIGLNLRTLLVNLSQPWTHTLPNLPGNPISNSIAILEGQVKSLVPIFSSKARDTYRRMGVLHDIEEIFTIPNVTHVTGTAPANMAYGAQWMLNHLKAVLFYGMRMTEISNRVAAHHATHRALTREAAKRGFSPMLNDPAFVQAIERASVNMANISNFLYGKGFKSPVQADLGAGLDSQLKRVRSLFGPLGELMYQYNTFGLKTIGMLMNMAKQAEHLGGNQPLAMRLAALNGPQEFGQFLQSMKQNDRYALLRYITFGTSVAAMAYAGLGLAGLAWQLAPTSILSLNPMTPVMTTLTKMIANTGTLNFGRAIATARRGFTPGYTQMQRINRGGSTFDQMFKTRSEMEGTQSPWAPDDISDQFGAAFGGASGRP